MAIINNVKNDTWELIKNNHAGINVNDKGIFDSSQLSLENINEMCINSRLLFEKYFSDSSIKEKLDDVLAVLSQ